MANRKKTNAVRIVEEMTISFELLEYTVEHGHTTAEDAAKKTGVPAEQMFKTLVARGDKTDVLMACVPGGRQLDIKALAAASGNKRVELVDLKEITPLTGYVRGGCSPIGARKKYPVYLDKSALNFEYILVNAGSQGLLFKIRPHDLAKAANAKTANIILHNYSEV